MGIRISRNFRFFFYFLCEANNRQPALFTNHLLVFPVLSCSIWPSLDIQIHPKNIQNIYYVIIQTILPTVIWSGSCHRCQITHHHMAPPTAMAPILVAFEWAGGPFRYETLIKLYKNHYNVRKEILKNIHMAFPAYWFRSQ